MKRIFALMLLLFTAYTGFAKDIQAVFSYATFDIPGQNPYIETYLTVAGRSVKYIPVENGKFQSSLQITLTYRQEEKISYTDKYNLLSPQVEDTSSVTFTFLDQKRVALKPGEYILNLTVADNNNRSNFATITERVKIGFPPDQIAISDITFLESYRTASEASALNKNGYEMVPLANNFFPTSVNNLIFYTEIYNADKIMGDKPFLLSYSLEMENGLNVPNMGTFKKETPRNINALLAEFDIQSLPTGNYNLVVEVRDRSNEMLTSKKVFFQRSNKNMVIKPEDISVVDAANFASIYNKETVAEHIRSLGPISTEAEQHFASNVILSGDVSRMQQYMVYFWQKRTPENPEKAWLAYAEKVKEVNAHFSSNLNKGYSTDRGRVYLKYGAPNNINANRNNPNAWPYEIWHYYKLNNQSNRKFVFYSQTGASNEYELLHSDAIGEPNDYRWKYKVLERDPNARSADLDSMDPNSSFNDRLDKDFE